MSKRDDVQKLYKHSKTIEHICVLLFWINVIISTLTAYIDTSVLLQILIYAQVIVTIVFVILETINDSIFLYNAEMARRKTNIQSAFQIQLTEFETEEYYNNSYNPSFAKYAVNTFESNFFSKNISGKMLMKSSIKAILALITLIISGYIISKGSIFLIITQAIFSTYLVEEVIMLTVYKIRMDKLYEQAYLEFITVGISKKSQIIWLMSYIIEYESIKAHYKVRLDSKLFAKNNSTLSKEWDNIQKQISIKNMTI